MKPRVTFEPNTSGLVTQPDKPRERSGYRREETLQVESACLTVAVTLGALMDDLCIVGGLVPSLIIDHELDAGDEPDDSHPGTNDLDVGIAVALLDDRQYVEISRRLRQEGFEPDTNENGNPTLQRWRWGDFKVTVDFLLAPIEGADVGGRVLPLESDFGVLIAPGLELAFEEREEITIDGHTLKGEQVSRTIPVCGPGAFVVLKAFAFGDRGEPKDAFDLVYVIRRWPEGTGDIADRLARHAEHHSNLVTKALEILARDFSSPDLIGPLRVAEFEGATDAERDEVAADAHGFVDDLLSACRERGLLRVA
jgi:predicted nucleotidyltransferase